MQNAEQYVSRLIHAFDSTTLVCRHTPGDENNNNSNTFIVIWRRKVYPQEKQQKVA